MSAIADFTVAVLDCHACCARFIANHVAVALRLDRLACPHCGAEYETGLAHDSAHASAASDQRAHARSRNKLHLVESRRRKLH
jgi:hypothetical protein